MSVSDSWFSGFARRFDREPPVAPTTARSSLAASRSVWLGWLAALGCAAAMLQPAAARSDENASKLAQLSTRAVAILKSKCVDCHGANDKLEGGLDVRSRARLLEGGETGPALVIGQSQRSLLMKAVRWEGDLRMPPKQPNRLTADEIATLAGWIDSGAPWSDAPATQPSNRASNRPSKTGSGNDDTTGSSDPDAEVVVRTTAGQSADWNGRKYASKEVWAYRPIVRPTPPAQVGDQAESPIDLFIKQRLIERKLTAAPPADPRILVRRVTLDLTGLPPTPEELDAFIDADRRSPEAAWRELVERLLASPRYGEQQARHWLDVTRYADSAGFSNDYERPNAWRWRDYVIRSFNSDKPFDRFIVEQLAGDELEPDSDEMQIAVGFLRMGPWEHTGMSVAAETRQQFLDDVTNSVGVTFLGQALRCAGCHDHKFDPVPTRDYYRIQAVFAPTQFAEPTVPFSAFENLSGRDAGIARLRRLLGDSERAREQILAKNRAALAELLERRGVKKVSELPAEEQSNSRFFGLSEQDKSTEKMLQKRIDYLQRELLRYEPLAMSVYDGPNNGYASPKLRQPPPPVAQRQGSVDETKILVGGSLAAAAEPVAPGVLSAVWGSNDQLEANEWNRIPDSTSGRRLALARWIASPRNTLTARVIVNRIWQQHFGRGLVATPNNFGTKGAAPTHPELLDWLAAEFIDDGWSIKRLHSRILASAVYRRSGAHPQPERLREVDPRNQLLAAYPARRLSAEELRDGLLAISGELNPAAGGPPAMPEIHDEVALQPRQIMGSVAPAYQPDRTPAERNRRTIFALRVRTLPDPFLETFNRPGADLSCELRDSTTVTPQVFALWNGRIARDRALALAARVAREAAAAAARDEAAPKASSDDAARTSAAAQSAGAMSAVELQVTSAFRLVYGRSPTKDERRAAVDHVELMTAHHRTHPPVAVGRPTSVTREMIEELTGEVFRWEEPLDRAIDYVPDLQPSAVTPEVRALAELVLVLVNSNEFLYVR